MREKVELLRAAGRLGDVSLACRRAGVSRDSFYRWRRALASLGRAGLRPARRSFPSRRIADDVVAAVLAATAEHPEWGKARVAREVAGASPTGVRLVWLDVDGRSLTTRRAREAWSASQGERRIIRERRVEVECPVCHGSFVPSGAPPFTCPSCGVGGVPLHVFRPVRHH